jgi:nicotinamide-nucleotide amidase
MHDSEITELLQALRDHGLRIATAESLTAGGIANVLTRIGGSSDVVNGGFAVYTNEIKTKLLGVPKAMLDEFTAVSAPVARAMAEGALERADSDLAVSVTGYAGPATGPEGTDMGGVVYMGVARNFNTASGGVETQIFPHRFPGGREEIRQRTIHAALEHVRDTLKLIP